MTAVKMEDLVAVSYRCVQMRAVGCRQALSLRVESFEAPREGLAARGQGSRSAPLGGRGEPSMSGHAHERTPQMQSSQYVYGQHCSRALE